DGTETEERHVQGLFILAEREAKRQQPAVMIDGRIGVDGNGAYDPVAAVVEDGDIVIGGVGDVGIFFAYGEAVGARATDDFGAFDHLADLVTGFVLVDDFIGCQIDRVYAHRFGGAGIAYAGDLSALPGIAINGLFGVVAIGMKGQQHAVVVGGRDIGEQRIVVQADVGDEGELVIRTEGESKRLTARGDRGGELAGGEIDADEAEIAAVEYEEFVGRVVVHEVGGEAVAVGRAVDLAVERNGVELLEMVDVIDDHRAVVAAAEIDG